MNVRQFLTFCESFYGEKYDGVFLDVMTGYLEGHSLEFLDSAANVLTRRFSRTHRKAPGPAEIEDNLDEISETIRKPVYLPEAIEKPSCEERKEMGAKLHKLRESFEAGKSPGPLSGIFSETLAEFSEKTKGVP